MFKIIENAWFNIIQWRDVSNFNKTLYVRLQRVALIQLDNLIKICIYTTIQSRSLYLHNNLFIGMEFLASQSLSLKRFVITLRFTKYFPIQYFTKK